MSDRESDIVDVFVDAQNTSYDVRVRGAWDRRLTDHPARYLWAAVEAAPVLGSWVIDVPRKEDHPLRQARLAARTTTVQLRPPAHHRAAGLNSATIGVVLAPEIDPPEGESPISWLLLTTLPVETLSEAQQIVQWYTFRWRIERLHFVLKTGGPKVEKLPLETFARLERDQSCTVAFTAEEQRAL